MAKVRPRQGRQSRAKSASREKRKRLVPKLPRITVDLSSENPDLEKVTQILENAARLNSLTWQLEWIAKVAAEGDPAEVPALDELRAALRSFRVWSGRASTWRDRLIDEAAGAALLRIGSLVMLCGFELDAITGGAKRRHLQKNRPIANAKRSTKKAKWIEKARKIAVQIWEKNPSLSTNRVAQLIEPKLPRRLRRGWTSIRLEIGDLRPPPAKRSG